MCVRDGERRDIDGDKKADRERIRVRVLVRDVEGRDVDADKQIERESVCA